MMNGLKKKSMARSKKHKGNPKPPRGAWVSPAPERERERARERERERESVRDEEEEENGAGEHTKQKRKREDTNNIAYTGQVLKAKYQTTKPTPKNKQKPSIKADNDLLQGGGAHGPPCPLEDSP